MLPKSDKKDKDEEGKAEGNSLHFDRDNKGDETEDEEAEIKKWAELFILKGFLETFRLLTLLSTPNHWLFYLEYLYHSRFSITVGALVSSDDTETV